MQIMEEKKVYIYKGYAIFPDAFYFCLFSEIQNGCVNEKWVCASIEDAKDIVDSILKEEEHQEKKLWHN